LTDHYPTLLDYHPEEPAEVQEWRRGHDGELRKGMRVNFDLLGNIDEVETPDGEYWEYLYTREGLPYQIMIVNTIGDTVYYHYNYPNLEYSQRYKASSDANIIYEKCIVFLNEHSQPQETKYMSPNSKGVMTTKRRLVRTFLSPDNDRIKGTMDYKYFSGPMNNNETRTSQMKMVYKYYPFGKLARKIQSHRKVFKGERPYRAEELPDIFQQWLLDYDNDKQLIRQRIVGATESDLRQVWNYQYYKGQLNMIDHTRYNQAVGLVSGQQVAQTSRTRFDEKGRLISYTYESYNAPESFRASLAWK
ncbi:MAG: hypothetical protein AAFO94_22015, partial [Bacteroidota bacterium]